MATPPKTNSLCQQSGDKKAHCTSTAVTPAPTGKRLTAAARVCENSNSDGPRHVLTSRDAEGCNGDNEGEVVTLVAAKKTPSFNFDGKSLERLEAKASHVIPSCANAKAEPRADKFTHKEGKAENVKDFAPPSGQPAGGPRRHTGSADQGCLSPLPPRHVTGGNINEVAKRRAGAPTPSGSVQVCKLASPAMLVHHGLRRYSIASKSNKSKDEDADLVAKRQAKGPYSTTVHKLAPSTTMASIPSQRRVASESHKSKEKDTDILAKCRARAPANASAICKLPPPTVVASILSYNTDVSASTKIASENTEAALGNRKAMSRATATAICKLPPSTMPASVPPNSSIVSGSNKSVKEIADENHQGSAPVDTAGSNNLPYPTMMASAPSYRTAVSSSHKTTEENVQDLPKCQARLPIHAGPTVHNLAPSTMLASTPSRSSAVANAILQNRFEDAARVTRIKAIGLALEEYSMVVAEVGLPTNVDCAADAKTKVRASAACGIAPKRTTARLHSVEEADTALKRNARNSSAELTKISAAPRHSATITALPIAVDLAHSFEQESHRVDCNVGAYSVGHEDADAVEDYLAKVAWNQAQEDPDDDDHACGPSLNGALSGNHFLGEQVGDYWIDSGLLGANNEDELDAEAGVPVTPGAFAVEGHEHQSERETSPLHCDSTLTDPNSVLFMEPGNPEAAIESQALSLEGNHHSSALEAELLEVFEANVLDDYDDRKWSKRCTHRWGVAAIALLASVGATVAIAATQTQANSGEVIQEVAPIVKGWNQVGTSLTGPTDDDKSLFGFDVAMDGQAQRIAIGVPGRDHSETELLVGSVHVMDWNGTDWQAHLPIFGPAPESQAGSAVAISRDGRRVAVGAPHFAFGRGHVAVYEEVEPTQWGIVGQILVGDLSKGGIEERFGGSLALSHDGSTLAVGAIMGDGERGADMGYVKVFQLETHSQRGLLQEWTQLGNTIYGENPGDFFGWSLDISSNGKRVVAGSVGSFGEGIGEFTGKVCAYDYNYDSSVWVQAGPVITGIAAFDSFGSSVSLSGDGSYLAVGAIGHSNTEKGVEIGHVRVFEFIDTPTGQFWEQMGQDLVGQRGFDSFGYSVSLSEDGKVVATGGPGNDEFFECCGVIQVFELDEMAALWNRRGSQIGSSYEGSDLFGWAVSLSSDGSVVAGGGPFSTFDGRLDNAGIVRIYGAVGENQE